VDEIFFLVIKRFIFSVIRETVEFQIEAVSGRRWPTIEFGTAFSAHPPGGGETQTECPNFTTARRDQEGYT
jgi:hypothetical protein